MAYTAISTEADDEIDPAANISASMTPIERYSSQDVIAAAAELKFQVPAQREENSNKISKKQAQQQLKRAYCTIAQTLNLNELEREYSTSLQNGLNYNQITLKREQFGWNIITPPHKTKGINECLKDYSFWCLIIGLILCIVITVMIPNIYSIILTIITFIPILLLIILTWHNSRNSNDDIADSKRTVTVMRKQNKPRYRLLVDAIIRKNQSNPPSVVRDLIVDYCCYTEQTIDAKELVVSDIVYIEKGEMIPADLRIFECTDDCHVDNSGLTGESEPQKRTSIPSDETPAEAPNLLFHGTLLVEGNAKCVCIAIGDSTFMGRTTNLCVPQEYISPYNRTVRSCKRCWSFVLCVVTTICFIIVLTANVPEGIVFLVWFILILIIVVFGVFAVGLLPISRNYLINRITDKYNILIKYDESAETLGMINVLVIGDDDLLNKGVLRCKDLGIKLVIITDRNSESAKLMWKEIGIENTVVFINGESIDMDRYYTDNQHPMMEYDLNSYDNVILYKTSKETFAALSIVHVLQEFRYIVGFIGLSMNNNPALKKADVSIAGDKSACDAVKEASDLLYLEEEDNALNDIMGAIEISQKFNQYFGWIIRY